jgi:hypothetical protein
MDIDWPLAHIVATTPSRAMSATERGERGASARASSSLVDGQRPARGERGGEQLVLELSAERRQVGPETEPALCRPLARGSVATSVVAGKARVWAIEGSASYGRGLGQFLAERGERVREVPPKWTAERRRTMRRPARLIA